MEKIKVEFNVFNYSELSEGIKDKLLKEHMEFDLEIYSETDLIYDMEEKAIELLKENFKEAVFKNVRYDLSYSQGSGAMIEFDIITENESISVIHNGSMYCHEYTFNIESSYLNYKGLQELKDKIIKINEELKTYGYNLIDINNFREFAVTCLEENQYLSNGEDIKTILEIGVEE